MKISHTATPSGKIVEYIEPDTVEKIMNDYRKSNPFFPLKPLELIIFLSCVMVAVWLLFTLIAPTYE